MDRDISRDCLRGCEDITIDGEKYNVSEAPRRDSGVVQGSLRELSCDMKFFEFFSDIDAMSGLISIAHDAALVLEEQGISSSVQRMGFDVTVATEQAHIAMHRMHVLAEDTVADIQGAHVELFVNLRYHVALVILENAASVAGDMGDLAKKMNAIFLEHAAQVKIIAETAQRAMSDRRQDLLRHRKNALKATAVLAESSEAQRVLSMTVSESHVVLQEARAREWWSYQRCAWVSFLDDATRAFQPMLGVEQSVRKAVAKCRRESRQAKNLVDSLAQHRSEALIRRSAVVSDVIHMEQKARSSHIQADVARVLIESLHKVVGVLKRIATNMMKTAALWSQLEAHTFRLGSSGDASLLLRILAGEDRTPTSRENLIRSQALQRRAIIYVARWIAIAEFGRDYKDRIHEARRVLYKFLDTASSYDQVTEMVSTW